MTFLCFQQPPFPCLVFSLKNGYWLGAAALAAFPPTELFMDALPKTFARLKIWTLTLIAALAGAASVLAMAPFLLWPVLFLTFPVLIWALDAVCLRKDALEPLTSVRRRILGGGTVGWGFGFGYFLAGIHWIGYAFYVDADRYAALMPLAVTGLAAALGLFYAVAGALSAALWRRGYARIAGFVFAFFCAEAARGYLFTGFPWNLFGQAIAANDAQMQAAAYVGIYGLTLAALYIFSSPAAAIASPKARFGRLWAPLCLGIVALAASYGFGVERLKQEVRYVEGVRVRIVQPNIPQAEKWKPENAARIFERILALSRTGSTGEDIASFTHVIWPESSVPVLFGFNGDIANPVVKERLAALIPAGTTLILGAERAEGEALPDRRRYDRAFNSLFVLGSGAKIAVTYDKIHLVPFGEYVPLQHVLSSIGFRAFSHRLDGFEAGSNKAPIMHTPRAPAFLPLICYEIIFPGRVQSLRNRPQWLVNVTNDAWFGASTGPYQHLQLARIRAVEEGLPVMRAANTGISAVIDPFGRVLAQLDLDNGGALDQRLPSALPVTFFEKVRLPLLFVLFLFPLQIYLIMVVTSKVG